MNPKPASTWWAIAGIVAAVAAVGVVSAQRDYSQESSTSNFLGPGYYSYGPASDESVRPAEMLPPDQLPASVELEKALAEADKLHQELIEQLPEPVVEDQPGFGARNGGKTRYESHVEFGALRIQSAHSGVSAAQTPVGGLLGAEIDDELLIRTGVEAGPVEVEIRALDHAPERVEPGWEDVSETSARAGVDARVAVMGEESYPEKDPGAWVQRLDAHGEGWYRIRVHANGRDRSTGEWVERPVEKYLVVAWPSGRAEPVVHRVGSEWARDLVKHDGTAGR